MKLHDDWQWIIRKAWSVRLIALAAILSGAEVVLPFFQDFVPRGVFGVLSFFVTGAALIARISAQPKGDV